MSHRYGLKTKPFLREPMLAKTDWKQVVGVKKVEKSLKKRFGDNLKYGLLVTKKPLSAEFVQKYGLFDIDKALNDNI